MDLAFTVLVIVMIGNILLMVYAAYMCRKTDAFDFTSDDWPNTWALLMMLTMVAWPVLTIIHLVFCLIDRQWIGAGLDALILLWIWWDFFDGGGKWKRFKKRAKEKVAVIKGRLKVIQVPGPAPA